MRDFRERVSTFSLDFLVIGLSNSDETRGKVDPRQGIRVGTVFVEFRKLMDVEVFFYLVYSLAKSHFNG